MQTVCICYQQTPKDGASKERVNISVMVHLTHIWASTPENLSSGGCEQLISAFVIRFLKGISKLASREISIFYLVSVAEQAGLELTLSEIPKTGFGASRPICNKPSAKMRATLCTLLPICLRPSGPW